MPVFVVPAGRSSGNVRSIRTVPANTTLLISDSTIVVTGTTDTLLMPATPIAGQIIFVRNLTAAGAVTLDGNGKTITLVAQTLPTASVANKSYVQLQYDPDAGTWRNLA